MGEERGGGEGEGEGEGRGRGGRGGEGERENNLYIIKAHAYTVDIMWHVNVIYF